MLYGTEGGGHGQKSKYTVLPRGGRVQLDFEMVLPGDRVQFCFSNSPAGRLSPIDKPAKTDRSGNRTRPP